ncbi:DUF5316 domain-containing protein [Bacillus sp. CLL-7-23]|uniref:DUF5316 domain-containing protein n=1 Tax=Bacillus changyiensis TaxID=3004103 RepID=A0ABT4X6W1_9BACI|nr:DUF5316 domain-containing protein [Bacillus changyiensis]MDA7028003.1 DUF5316 domain-containing protein [Bacillus changyiensis]
MKKWVWFLIGLVSLALTLIVSIFAQNYNLIIKISGTIGVISILISGIFLGAFVNGDKQRANYFSETKEHRKTRTIISINILLVGLPHIFASIIFLII